MSGKRVAILALGLAVLTWAVILAACGGEKKPAPTPFPTQAPCPEPTECPEYPEGVDVPFVALWTFSGHADAEAPAFRNWDEDDPPLVPANCARCHSGFGFQDFVGADGSAAGTVENDAQPEVITCVACHNEAAAALDSAVFPSGAEITSLGPEARCMLCHQGRESTASVNETIADVGVDDDTSSEGLGFVNIHYYAAAATMYGTLTQGGYEYEGKSYDGKFDHVAGFDSCVGCHDAHTLELRLDACSICHADVATRADLADIRMPGSLVDYDGDGDTGEGIFYEIQGLQEILYRAIQTYARDAGTPIAYDAHTYPYFFVDSDANGEVDQEEASYTNRYNAWTPRLLKAAYNYQTSLKDPGAFAHGGKYIIQLLYDSIEDLDADLVAGLSRIDHGHFAGSEEAFRHWDGEGAVPGSCSKCHSAAGLPFFLKEGVNVTQPIANGLTCSTCHDDVTAFTRYVVDSALFPSGARLDSGNSDSNLCLNCHQGRESKVSVDAAIAGLDEDVVSDELGFLNVHYFAAGATLFGTEAKGAYEYDGQTYFGRFAHVEGFDSCTQCHSTHRLEVRAASCGECHSGVESEQDLHDIRRSAEDYDGDGDTDEGIAGEIETYQETVYAALQDYAAGVIGTAIQYDAARYPYWFTGDGERFAAWTPRLLQAAYNYQYVAKDPGAFAHNGRYIIQVLYDTLANLGERVPVDLTGKIRP